MDCMITAHDQLCHILTQTTGQCRYSSSDGELYKDVEGVLEVLCNAIGLWHRHSGQLLAEQGLARGLLQLWDGICCLLSAQAKPDHWLQQLLKALKSFAPEARSTAADWVVVRTGLPVMAHADCTYPQLQPCPLDLALSFFPQLWQASAQRPRMHYRNECHHALQVSEVAPAGFGS